MADEAQEIAKRLTLNWLIQGASQHAGMTFQHLVRDELNALHPRLVRLYDQFALIGLLQYWRAQSTLLLGWPPRFWRRAASKRDHPFFSHPLLSRYGGLLAHETRQRALERCKEKGVTCLPFAFSFQTAFLVFRLQALEMARRPRLIQLAQKAAGMVWGIPPERLDGELVSRIELGKGVIPARSVRGTILRACTVGYGGVVRRGAMLKVSAIATNWHVLTKEFVKGTAELICLHGLNQLSDDTYRRVIEATDRLEFEPWMLQSGGELWRRLLTSIPDGCPLPQALMQLARLPAGALESVIEDVITKPGASSEPFGKVGGRSKDLTA